MLANVDLLRVLDDDPSHACAACSFLRCVSAGSWNVRWHLFVAM